MDLNNLKEQINKAGFSEEAIASLNLILEGVTTGENLSEEDRGKIAEIVDQEIEQAEIQASIMEEIAFALEEYAGEVDLAAKIADEKTKSVEDNFNSEMDDLEDQVNQVPAANSPNPSQPVI
jgi:hypothetical protein